MVEWERKSACISTVHASLGTEEQSILGTEEQSMGRSRGGLTSKISCLVENEDDYLFAAITASYKSLPVFEPVPNGAGDGKT